MPEARWESHCPDPECEWTGKPHTSKQDAWDELCRHMREHKELVARVER